MILCGRFAAVNVEFEESRVGFQECFQEKFQKLEHRVDEVELGGDPVEADSLEVSSFKLRMEDLLKQRLEDRVRINSLESRLGSDTISVVIGEHSEKGPSILRSSEDLRSYITTRNHIHLLNGAVPTKFHYRYFQFF